MALIKCPECSKDISDKASLCISCGYPIKSDNNGTTTGDTKSDSNIIFTSFTAIIVVFIIVILMVKKYENNSENMLKQNNRRDIENKYQHNMIRDGVEGDKYNDSVKEYFRQK